MRLSGTDSWSITLTRWNEWFDYPLWLRAAERIPAPPGGLVPGPLDLDPRPAPSGVDADALVEGWTSWWSAVVTAPTAELDGPPWDPALRFSPPDFPGLAAWPALRELAASRWEEAMRWQQARKAAGVDAFARSRPGPQVVPRVVAEVERELRRPVPPFRLTLVLLPVRDDEIRTVGTGRHLVPERVYESAEWGDRLRPLVAALCR